MKSFFPDGRAPISDDIMELARVNVPVQHCMSLWEKGDLTWEEALMAAVLVLADQNRQCCESLIETAFKQKTVYLTKP